MLPPPSIKRVFPNFYQAQGPGTEAVLGLGFAGFSRTFGCCASFGRGFGGRCGPGVASSPGPSSGFGWRGLFNPLDTLGLVRRMRIRALGDAVILAIARDLGTKAAVQDLNAAIRKILD